MTTSIEDRELFAARLRALLDEPVQPRRPSALRCAAALFVLLLSSGFATVAFVLAFEPDPFARSRRPRLRVSWRWCAFEFAKCSQGALSGAASRLSPMRLGRPPVPSDD